MLKKFNVFALALLIIGQTILGPMAVSAEAITTEPEAQTAVVETETVVKEAQEDEKVIEPEDPAPESVPEVPGEEDEPENPGPGSETPGEKPGETESDEPTGNPEDKEKPVEGEDEEDDGAEEPESDPVEENSSEAIQAATDAVEKAEASKTEEDIEHAVALVEALEDGEEKAALQARLDVLLEGSTINENAKFHLNIGAVTDLDGNPYGEDKKLGLTDQFKLQIDFTLDNGHSYENGHTVTFKLPDQIVLQGEVTDGELYDGNDLVARYIINANKEVILTFTDFVENNSDISGYLEIIVKLDLEKAEEEDGKVTISPIGEENELTIPIDKGETSKTIEKQGKPNKAYGPDELIWTVTVNKDQLSLNDATITDVLPEGTKYKESSLKVTKQKTNLNGTVISEEIVEITPGYTGETNELVIDLGDINERYVIEYVTTITDEDVAEFKNNATLSDNDLEDREADATITVAQGEPIKKRVLNGYDPKTGIIEWEIELNYNQKDVTNLSLWDEWTPAGKLELIDGSLKFQEVSIDENGQTSSVGDPIDLPAGATLEKKADGFEVSNITTDKPYKVTYQTKVIGRVLESFEVENTAGFGTDRTTGTGNTEIGQYYGSKSAIDVDYKDKKITWKIELNHDEYPMEKISFVDTLGPGLYLNADSIIITVDGQSYTGDYDLLNSTDGAWAANDNPFKIQFPKDFTTDKKIEVTYLTDYVANEIPESKPTNGVAITWTPGGETGPITKDISTSTELNDHSRDSSWKSGSYNPAKKEITWTIYTNYRENYFENLIIKDTPQQNQKLNEGSITVTELAIAANGAITEVGTVENPNVQYDGDSFTLTIDETSKAYKIEYTTSLAGLVDIEKEYTNKAEILDGAGNKPVSEIDGKVGIFEDRKYGSKSGQQDGKQIHWSIDVNIAQEKITDLALEDKISVNQEYLEHTIKVYEVSYNAEGKAVKGDVFTNYDLDVNETDFTINWRDEVERAYIVEYSTIYFAKHDDPVSNSYIITGLGIDEGEKSASDTHEFKIEQFTSGGAVGTAGYLIISKKRCYVWSSRRPT